MTLSNTELTFLAPGLLGPQAVYPSLQKDERGDFPGLEKLLSHAQITPQSQLDWLQRLFKLLALSETPASDLPLASICAVNDGVTEADGWWLRLDPVYVQIDRDRAVMLGADELALNQGEADNIVHTFNTHFAEDGLEFIAPHPQRWYVRIDNAVYQTIRTTPLAAVMGQNINDYLPRGDAQQYWHRFLNEIQMLLYNHAVNEERENDGRVSINSVWFWGGGELPDVPERQWEHIYTDDRLATMLARFCRTPCSPLSALKFETITGRDLIVMPECTTYPARDDVFAWLQQLARWEQQMFSPLLARLKTDKLVQASLLCDQRDFTVTAKGLRRWWRRRRSLDAFLAPVAA